MAKKIKYSGAACAFTAKPSINAGQNDLAAEPGGLAAAVRGIYQSDRKLQLVLLVFMLIWYGVLLSISWRLLLWGNPLNLTFNSMFDHLMHGRFDVDPQIVGREGFVRGGRVYAYWGIWCSLVRLPLWVFHRMSADVTVWSCLAAVCVAGMAKVRAVLLIRRHSAQNPVAGVAIGLMLAYILLGGSETAYLYVSIFQEVVFWAAAFSALFVYFAVKGIVSRSFDDKTLCWMALCAGLALLTRVSTGIGLILAMVLLLLVLAIQTCNAAAQENRLVFWRFGQALIQQRTLIPLGILAAFIAVTGVVNYFRWGNPATFANYYIYLCNNCVGNWVPRLREYGTFNLARIPFGLQYFFFPVGVLRGSDGHFLLESTRMRLFNTVEVTPASFFLTDLLPLCFIVFLGIAGWRRRSASQTSVNRVVAIAVGLLAPCVLMVTASSLAYRYRMEFYPEIDFLALLGLYLTVSDDAMLAKFVRFRRWITASLMLSIVSSFAALTLYNLGGTNSQDKDAADGIVHYYRQEAAEKYQRLMTHYFASHR